MNARQLILDLLARDKASGPIGTVGGALDDLGDEAADAARDLAKLDQQIAETTAAMQLMAQEAARTGDLDLTKGIRRYEGELRKLNKIKLLLPEPEMPDLGKGIGSNLAGSPYIAAGLAAAGAAAAPALGAAVSAGLIGSVGAGGVIGAVALLASDVRIKTAGQALGENLLAELREGAAPAMGPLLDAIDDVDARAEDLGDTFQRITANSFRNFDGLTDPALDGVEDLLDAFGDLSTAIDPVWDALGGGGERVLGAVADGLRLLSDNGTEGAAAIDALGRSIELGVNIAFGFVNVLTEVYGWSLRLRAALGDDLAEDALARYATGATDAANATGDLGFSYQAASEDAEDLAAAIQAAVDAEREQIDLNISAAEANLRYAETLDRTKEAIDGKGGASRAERDALLDLARASNDQLRALEAQGAATDVVTKAAADAEWNFRKQASAAGLSAAEVDKMTAEFLSVPKHVTTNIYLRGVDAALAAAASLRTYLRNIPDEDVYIAMRVTGSTNVSASRAALAKQYAFSSGGLVTGPGTSTSDSISARLSAGEYVVRAAAVRRPGVQELLERINSGGGPAGAPAAAGAAWGASAGRDSLTLRIASGDPLLAQILAGLSGIYRTQAGRDVNVLFGGDRV